MEFKVYANDLGEECGKVEEFAKSQGIENGVWVEVTDTISVFVDKTASEDPIFASAVQQVEDSSEALGELAWNHNSEWEAEDGEEFNVTTSEFPGENCKVDIYMLVS